MNRPLLRAPKSLRRRPYRARRVAAVIHGPFEYSTERAAPRALVIVATVLALLVIVELAVALVVIA
ncbi:hypothetical protein [Microbacterium sp. CFBP 8794]|uniref:hypothetical protein n=1 Tax=Microbacterium sp. CFBP 8794 TaxID=2775269 RepID=UPI00177FE6BF|nr:hypothetical protein [Microbacterium sp. CFBP 8794]MBD8477609.1 hypothetical protein [Microbacterium sp. CFBP 8794]